MATPTRTLTATSPAIPLVFGEHALVAVRLSGNEAINGLFDYKLWLKTPDTLSLGPGEASNYDLNAFIGCEISCVIELDGAGQFVPGRIGTDSDRVGAGTREINAIVTAAAFWGEEGRHAQYRLTLRPFLHLATVRVNCRTFQNKSVVEILDELLGAYSFPVEKRLIDSYPVLDFQMQFNESDYDFFLRLTQEHGINFFWAHSEGHHRLVLVDNNGSFFQMPSEAYRQVDFHPPGKKIDGEYISSFVPYCELTAGSYVSRDYDYSRPRADLTVARKAPRPTGQNLTEVYEFHKHTGGSHYAQPRAGTAPANDPHADGDQLARIRMEALRTGGASAEASGNLRAMVTGHTFALQGHPNQRANSEHLVRCTSFLIEDVGEASQIKDAAASRKQGWHIEVDFNAHPMSEPLRPALTQPKPQIGMQTAVVVGAEGENIWTDGLARVKVQFHWDRAGQKNQHSSCWVRVNSLIAGNQLGAIHLPRIGQEVIIGFFGEDADLPVCLGMLYNQNNLPPWELPGQAALSGFRSRELTPQGGNSAAGRSNSLAFDDTRDHIQAQLRSDHLHSTLSLGDINRIDGNAGRKEPRGEGFELGTGGHGALRADHGMLISTEARANAQRHILDIDETLQRLTEARHLLEQITTAAQHHEAQTGGTGQREVLKAVQAQNQGIKGTGEPRGEFSAPHLLLASPAGIASSTPESTHIASGQHTQITTGEHLSIAAGGGWFASVVDRIAVFVQRAGMMLVAAAGKISIQAHSDGIELIANKVLALISQTDYVDIKGKKGVRLWGGSSMLEISDLTQFMTPKPVLFHGSLETLGPKSISQHFNTMPTSNYDQQVRFLEADGKPAEKVAYDLLRDGGNIVDGKTGASGITPLQKSPDLVRYTVRFKGELP